MEKVEKSILLIEMKEFQNCESWAFTSMSTKISTKLITIAL